MSVLHYIDNEVPAFGEWDAIVTTGGGNMSPVAGDLNGRGSVILRATNDPAGLAYARKDPSLSLDYGETVHIGFYLRVNSYPSASWTTLVLRARNAAASLITEIYPMATGELRFYGRDDSGVISGYSHTVAADSKHYITLGLRRATGPGANDGWFRVYLDGQLINEWANVDNDVLAADLDFFQIGQISTGNTAYSADFDEIKIGTTLADVEPWHPTPSTEYLEAARTLVLYRTASADSVEFAEYCVSELGIPLANLVPLPNATANETLADYATFQSEVETDLAAWLAANPAAASHAMAFLIGYGVPGYFFDGGVRMSAVSRLMNYGTAFSSQTANPLYLGTTGGPPVRLTKADLDAAGITLATRIDADSLVNAKAILDAGLTVSALDTLVDADSLYSDDSTYLASLACQRLRLVTAALGVYADDAFVWGDTGSPSFGAAGSRVCFTDDSAEAADTLRAASEIFDAIVTNGYAAGLGSSAAADTFDAGSFFEMLRIGGTFAEAVAVSVANVDYTAVAAGVPGMTVAFQLGGYNYYRTTDYTLKAGERCMEWAPADLAACTRPGVTAPALKNLITCEDADHYIGVRAVSDSGVEEANTDRIVRVRISGGALVQPPPADMPDGILPQVAVAAGGVLTLHFYYNERGWPVQAASFQVAPMVMQPDGLQPDWANLVDTITAAGTKRYAALLAGTFSGTVHLAVRAVSSSGTAGAHAVASPVNADGPGATNPDYVEAEQYDTSSRPAP